MLKFDLNVTRQTEKVRAWRTGAGKIRAGHSRMNRGIGEHMRKEEA